MTFDVEIMLRHDQRVFTETLTYPGDPGAWTDADAGAVLKQILHAIDRVMHPQGTRSDRPVSLRGMSWIVSPHQDGVVIAFEIHSASAVAGPFRVSAADLDGKVRRAVLAEQPVGTVH